MRIPYNYRILFAQLSVASGMRTGARRFPQSAQGVLMGRPGERHPDIYVWYNINVNQRSRNWRDKNILAEYKKNGSFSFGLSLFYSPYHDQLKLISLYTCFCVFRRIFFVLFYFSFAFRVCFLRAVNLGSITLSARFLITTNRFNKL